MDTAAQTALPSPWRARRLRPAAAVAAIAGALLLFSAFGLLGTYRYLENFWLYRGFSPPSDPGWVQRQGKLETFRLASPSLGGRKQQVEVYLPPGYAASPRRRYPVLYLLHGVPGRPGAFIQTVRMGVVEDVLVARHRAQPLILVMPFGSTGAFTDKEWANGVRPHENWESFVARDLVHAIDSRYRTIRAARGRALAGLSEGGYGALNIGFHHPREFSLLESWSGYAHAADVKSIFGAQQSLLVRNSPALVLKRRAGALRRAHVFVWFYTGHNDPSRQENASFAAALGKRGIGHAFFVVRGGHTWATWRGQASRAYLAAADRLAHA